MNGLTKEHDFGEGPLTDERYVWTCAIGGSKPVRIPPGGDVPMRQAVEDMFKKLTGEEAQGCFSGWGSEFTEQALAVLENRLPIVEQTKEDRLAAEIARLKTELADTRARISGQRHEIRRLHKAALLRDMERTPPRDAEITRLKDELADAQAMAFARAVGVLDKFDGAPCKPAPGWSEDEKTGYHNGQVDAAASWRRAILALSPEPPLTTACRMVINWGNRE